jgi:acyl carrier protein
VNPVQAREAVTAALASVAPEADLDAVDPGARLREELDLDSLDFLNLVQALKDITGVEIPEADYRQVDSLTELLGYLESAQV